MGPLLLVLSLAAPPGADTLPPFADSVTRRVVEHAIARQQDQDTLVSDYTARLHYRLTVAFGRRRWARIPPFGVEEQDATVHWQRPNDIRVDLLGERSLSRSPDADINSGFDRPWFLPRALSDSVRILNSDFPARAALHPFAPDGPSWYRYAVTDSVRIGDGRGQLITLLGITVVPRREGLALVAGTIWVDEGTWDVVRFSFRFVGTGLWSVPDHPTHADSLEAERDDRLADRILTVDVDLEYGLQDRRFWMPFRQTLSGQVVIPYIGDLVIPFSVSTTFDDYEINSGRTIAFALSLPDTTAVDSAGHHEHQDRTTRSDSTGRRDIAGRYDGGGRYEMHVPPRDSLRAYAGWTDPLVLDRPGDERADLAQVERQLADLAETLPRQMTGAPGPGLALEHLADAFRYERVQGLALGFGWKAPIPGVRYTSVYGAARYGFSDDRITGRVELIRESPVGRWTLRGYREVTPVDRAFPAGALANSVNALFTAHDAADWMLVQGGELRYETSLGVGVDLSVAGRVDDERSAPTRARSAVNDLLGGDGRFPADPPVSEGIFGGATVRLGVHRGSSEWMAGADVLAGAAGQTAKVFGEWRAPLWSARLAPVLTLRGGIATAHPLPQVAFRVGGPWTARAFGYGSAVGAAFWASQVDLPLARGAIRPVAFADAAQAGTLDGIPTGPVLADAGLGLSILGGAVRFDLGQPLTGSAHGPRFDIVFGGAR